MPSEGRFLLGVVDDFRTLNWVEMIKYPELILQQSKELLQIT
jgi:hypothetical protein